VAEAGTGRGCRDDRHAAHRRSDVW
jgi:hypothetical protein